MRRRGPAAPAPTVAQPGPPRQPDHPARVWPGLSDIAFALWPDHVSVVDMDTGWDVGDWEPSRVVVPTSPAAIAGPLRQYLNERGLPVAPPATAPCGRLWRTQALVLAGLPVPETWYVAPTRLDGHFEGLGTDLGVPFVLRGIDQGSGAGACLVVSRDDVFLRLADPEYDQMGVIAQRLIPATYDYRVVIMSGRVRSVLRRPNPFFPSVELRPDTRGVSVGVGEFPWHPRIVAVRAAGTLGMATATVDLIRDWRTGQWSILDVADLADG